MFTRSLLLVFSLGTLLLAGPNADAVLHFDFNPATEAIDSSGGCPEDSSFTVAVVIENAKNLFSYEVYVEFDPASLEFVTGRKGSNAYPNILEENDASTVNKIDISKDDSANILIGVSLLGASESECATGDGILALLTFEHIKEDTTYLEIKKALCIDYDEVEDTDLEINRGEVTAEATSIFVSMKRKPSMLPNILRQRNSTSIHFASGTQYALVVVNTRGQKLYSTHGFGAHVAINHRDFAGSGMASGMQFLKLQAGGGTTVLPLVVQ